MKIAIIGAGPSGLACAIQLERLGVIPDIFEIDSKIGDSHENITVMLHITNRPINDALLYLKEKYNISIEPYGFSKKIIHYGPNTKSIITGDLGYFIYRGKEEYSLENQLARILNSKITFSTYADYKKLKSEYDYVVVATGKNNQAREMGIWNDIIYTQIKGEIVVGEFDSDAFSVFFNKNYCNSGYAYLTPFDTKHASLVLIVTGIQSEEIDSYWDLFIKTEDLKYEVVEYFTREDYGGLVYPHKVENIYFVGNAGGAIEPWLGFGQLTAIISGMEAANCIVKDLDYEEQLTKEINRNLELVEFRKVLNTLDNDKLDLLVKSIGLPGANSLIYNTNIDYVKYGSKVIKTIDNLFGDKV